MNEAPTLDSVLDAAMRLPSLDQDLLVEILNKRQIAKRRGEMAAHAREAREALHTGMLTAETADELIGRLHTGEQEAKDR